MGEGRKEMGRARDAAPAGDERKGVEAIERLAVRHFEEVGLGGDDETGAAAPAATAATPAAAASHTAAAATDGIGGSGHVALAEADEVELVGGEFVEACEGVGTGGDGVHDAVSVGEALLAILYDKALGAATGPGDGDRVLGDVGDFDIGSHATFHAEVVDKTLAPVAVGREELEGYDMAVASVGGKGDSVMRPALNVAADGVDGHKAVGVKYAFHYAQHQPALRPVATKVGPEVQVQLVGGQAAVAGVDGGQSGKAEERVGGVELQGVVGTVVGTADGAGVVAADSGEPAPVVGEAVVGQIVEVAAERDVYLGVQRFLHQPFVVAVVCHAVALGP